MHKRGTLALVASILNSGSKGLTVLGATITDNPLMPSPVPTPTYKVIPGGPQSNISIVASPNRANVSNNNSMLGINKYLV